MGSDITKMYWSSLKKCIDNGYAISRNSESAYFDYCEEHSIPFVRAVKDGNRKGIWVEFDFISMKQRHSEKSVKSIDSHRYVDTTIVLGYWAANEVFKVLFEHKQFPCRDSITVPPARFYYGQHIIKEDAIEVLDTITPLIINKNNWSFRDDYFDPYNRSEQHRVFSEWARIKPKGKVKMEEYFYENYSPIKTPQPVELNDILNQARE